MFTVVKSLILLVRTTLWRFHDGSTFGIFAAFKSLVILQWFSLEYSCYLFVCAKELDFRCLWPSLWHVHCCGQGQVFDIFGEDNPLALLQLIYLAFGISPTGWTTSRTNLKVFVQLQNQYEFTFYHILWLWLNMHTIIINIM